MSHPPASSEPLGVTSWVFPSIAVLVLHHGTLGGIVWGPPAVSLHSRAACRRDKWVPVGSICSELGLVGAAGRVSGGCTECWPHAEHRQPLSVRLGHPGEGHKAAEFGRKAVLGKR